MKDIVNGFDSFIATFKNYSDNYIIVGGTATNILLRKAYLTARSTKDIDMILIAENLTPDFGKVFWNFIKSGEYVPYFSKDNIPHYYRFINNSNLNYPKMIELFSRKQGLEMPVDLTFTHLFIDNEVSSLSAIILDDEYYSFMLSGKINLDGVSLLSPFHLIAFKARAHVDLCNKKSQGLLVCEKDLKKHKNDIFRLLQLLDVNEKYPVPDIVKKDIKDFLSIVNFENVSVEKLTNGALSYDLAVNIIMKVFNIHQS